MSDDPRQALQNTNTHDGNRLLSHAEVAYLLGITPKEAEGLIRRKMVPVVRVLGRNRVRERDLLAFIADRPVIERRTPAKKRAHEETTHDD